MTPMDRFLMLYCDQSSCRVNTFEAGDGSDDVRKRPGLCPGCSSPGLDIETSQLPGPAGDR